MKEIVNILDYSNTIDKQINLFNLIKKIKKKYKVCISSHYVLPSWILNEVDFYYYDKENIISYDPELLLYKWFSAENWKIWYKPYFTIASHTQPILSLILPSGLFLKSFGYEIVHQLEYDSDILNFSEFEINSKILETYDVVGYVEEKWGNTFAHPKFILGSYQAFKLNSFTFEELKYDFDEIQTIIHKMSKEHQLHFEGERSIFERMYKNKKIYSKDISQCEESIEINKFIRHGNDFNKMKNEFCVYQKNKKLWFFASNLHNSETQNLKIIIDDKKTMSFDIIQNFWIHIEIHDDDFKKITCIVNEKDIKVLDKSNPKDEFLLNEVIIERF